MWKVFGAIFGMLLSYPLTAGAADMGFTWWDGMKLDLSAAGGMSFNASNQVFSGGLGYGALDHGSPKLGFEILNHQSETIQAGAFYDFNRLTGFADGSASAAHFYGAMIRYELTFLRDTFVDLKLGAAEMALNRLESTTSFSFGAGVGYWFLLGPRMKLAPRVEYRRLQDFEIFPAGATVKRSFYDAEMIFSMRLF